MHSRPRSVQIKHSFEAAHRLPHLGGKCVSLHGHSWQVSIEVSAKGLTTEGTVVEFGWLKKVLRGWVDENFDHATLLSLDDPLCETLRQLHCKVFRFGEAKEHGLPAQWASSLRYPTVEIISEVLAIVTDQILLQRSGPLAWVSQVEVRETSNNMAIIRPPEILGWSAGDRPPGQLRMGSDESMVAD